MRFSFALFLAGFVFTANAQSNNPYQADLIALRNLLEKTPSFKDQMKGDELIAYNQLFDSLMRDTVKSPSDFNYFYNLSRLFFPIRDNHLGFYQTSNIPSDANFPVFKGNLDSLMADVAKRPLDSLEGIFHYDKFYSIALFKSAPAAYLGVVVDSKVDNWKPGQIALHLYEYGPHIYKGIYAHPKFKNLTLVQAEKYSHHSLLNSYFYASFFEGVYSKTSNTTDYVTLPKSRPEFVFQKRSESVDYLQIKHFSADPLSMQRSAAFRDSIQSLLTAPNLILDLRNNQGGANKVSRKYLPLIRNYAKKGRVFVLVNYGTMSQGEIFLLQLKKLKTVKILGQTTRGMITYGSNYGRRNKLPSQSFEAYLTDMYGKGARKLLPYESVGINPDIILSEEKDWVEQTMERINGAGAAEMQERE